MSEKNVAEYCKSAFICQHFICNDGQFVKEKATN